MRIPNDTREARLILNALPGIGPVTVRRLCEHITGSGDGDAREIFAAAREQLLGARGVGAAIADTLLNWERHFDLARELEHLAARQLRFITPADGDAYPPLLRAIHDPPLGLYTDGAFRWDRRCVAIVGTRYATAYGKQTARVLARELALRGWCVVSGLARGIDAAAHEGALEADGAGGGGTVAVLGCGVDLSYPPENKGLRERIAAAGAVVSEFVLGRKADAFTFPMRNRLVSGMSRAVVVIESDTAGGSMITAGCAGEQGRGVCAVPGRVDSPASRGCHALVRDGATLVTCVDEILEACGTAPAADYGIAGGSGTGGDGTGGAGGGVLREDALPAAAPSGRPLEPDERAILEKLTGGTALAMDALAEQTGIHIAALSATLLMMELDGLLTKQPDGTYTAG
ncbi:MAG: DNA-processing protein DprA [Puniceicoccales bacterium]|nr:DNA-processing protein DprA [Puniceicoccales bacterium]